MNVAELIAYLQTQPQYLTVVYSLYSERCMLTTKDIMIIEACEVRPDGWVANKRPDKPVQTYLALPGN